MLENLNITKDSINLIESSEKELANIYNKIDDISNYNSAKVLNAFIKNNLSEIHFNATTGYGYNDIG